MIAFDRQLQEKIQRSDLSESTKREFLNTIERKQEYMNQKLIEQYKQLHATRPRYGSNVRSCMDKYWEDLIHFLKKNHVRSCLDFGAGKGVMTSALNEAKIHTVPYDPAISEINSFPRNVEFDAVVCLDVIEHLDDSYEEEFSMIEAVKPRVIYFNIGIKPAAHKLPDGTNCHTLLKTPDEWKQIIPDFFKDFTLNDFKIDHSGAPSVILKLKKV